MCLRVNGVIESNKWEGAILNFQSSSSIVTFPKSRVLWGPLCQR